MANYDGRVAIDVGLGTADLKKSIGKISGEFGGMCKSIERTGRTISSITGHIAKTEEKVADLKERIDELGNSRIPTEDYKRISNETEKAGQKLEALLNRQEKYDATGVSKDSDKWKSLQYDLDMAKEKFDRLYEAKQQMEQSGTAYVAGSETEEYEKLATELQHAERHASELRVHLHKAKGELKEAGDHTEHLKAANQEYSKSFSKLVACAKRFALTMLGARSVYTILRKAVSAYMDANENLNNTLNNSIAALGNQLGPIIERVIGLFSTLLTYVSAFLKLIGLTGDNAKKSINKAGAAAQKARKSLAGFDEITTVGDKSSGGSSSGSSGISEFDTSAAEAKIKPFIDKIKALWDDGVLKNIVGAAAAIAATIAGFKFSKAFLSALKSVVKYFGMGDEAIAKWGTGLKIAGGILLTFAGVKMSYDANFNIARGVGELSDYIKRFLGPIAAAIGGALIGSAVPGLGTVAGAVIGLTLALAFSVFGSFAGAKQKLLDDFDASEFGQAVMQIKERAQNMMQISSDLRVHIESITGEVDSNTMANFEMAQKLIDEIFEMDSSDNKTAAEIQIIQEKVETLNRLGLEGVTLSFDEATGHIAQTKSSIQQTMDALLEQYKMEALREGYIQLYRDDYEARMNLNKATKDFTEAGKKLIKVQERQSKILDDIAYWEGQYNDALYDTNLTQEEATKKVNEAWKKLTELHDELKGLPDAEQRCKEAVYDAKKAMDDANDVVDLSSKKLWEYEKSMRDTANAAEEQGENVTAGIVEGARSGLKDIEQSANDISDTIIGTIGNDLEMHSPSKVMADMGKYVDEGFANGITENAPTVVNAMRNMLNTLISKVENFTNKCRSAVSNMMRDISKTMNSTSVNASGKVSYTAIPSVKIPLLAQGAVLPANKPFMAVVGDQKHGTNVEAPLETIQEAVALVMQDMITSNLAGHEATVAVLREILEAVLGISIGDDVIAGAVSRYQRKMAVVRGGVL